MLVHRVLDVFFRSLDAVDAVRDKVDQVRGKSPKPDPWAVQWPPADKDINLDDQSIAQADAPEAKKTEAKKSTAKSTSNKTTAKKANAKKSASSSSTKAAAGNSRRKGSVDRSGKDLTSPQAERIYSHLTQQEIPIITAEADLNGKRVLARVVWALGMAEAAGVDGCTTKDVSALLSVSSQIEVYSTNVGRACRDHKEFIEVADSSSRSKTYRLTAKGAEQLKLIKTHS